MKARAGKRPAAAPWACLQADCLQAVACLLTPRDRFKLNLVCRGWRDALEDAPQVWDAVTIDPRKKASTSRRVRFNKNLPTPQVLAAWFGRYGCHVRQLHLRHLDAASRAEGCGAAPDMAAVLQAVASSLRQLVVQQCTVQALLSGHAATLRSLRCLTSLHLQLPPEESLSLGTPQAAFITALSGLQDLALASGYSGRQHSLPASLAALPRLRSLQLARLGGARGITNDPLHPDELYVLAVAPSLAGLSALERLVLSDWLLVEEQRGEVEDPEGVEVAIHRLPPALLGLPSLSSLVLSDVGLGKHGPGPAAIAQIAGDVACRAYALPAELARLAGSLRKLALLNHTCGQQELAVLSLLSNLTSLSLVAKWRAQPTHLPDAFAQLTGLQQLKLSHGLTQVPPCITGLTQLTLLDLSFNSLKSIKPGEYLKRLVAVNLRANLLSHFPGQLKVARHTAVELQLPQNDSMTITERDVEQLLTFEKLRQLTIFGASEDKGTRRCLAMLAKAMPWLLIDV
ncbi:hypothetical protein ABPG75_010701 [Micractinium tetrahymenae]